MSALEKDRPCILFTTPKGVAEQDGLSAAEKALILEFRPEIILLLNPMSTALDSFLEFAFQDCQQHLRSIVANLYSHSVITALRLTDKYNDVSRDTSVSLDYRPPEDTIGLTDRQLLQGKRALVLPNFGDTLDPSRFLEAAYLASLDYPGLLDDRRMFYTKSSCDWGSLSFSQVGRSLVDAEVLLSSPNAVEDLYLAEGLFYKKIDAFRAAIADLSVGQRLLTV
jgi:hypothetical protein